MTSASPDPSRTAARSEPPTTGSSSPVYPEEQGRTAPADQAPAGAATAGTTATSTTPATTTAPVQRTRAASFWVSVVVTALVLIALIIFLAQNSRQVAVHFL